MDAEHYEISRNTASKTDRVREEGGIHAILSAMDAHRDKSNVQEKAIDALSYLTEVSGPNATPDPFPEFDPVINKVVRAMKDYTQEFGVQQASMLVLRHLCSAAGVALAAVTAGVFYVTIHALKEFLTHAKADLLLGNGCETIGLIISEIHQNAEAKDYLSTTGLDAIIAVFRKSYAEQGQRDYGNDGARMQSWVTDAAASALQKLARSDQAINQRLGQQGIVLEVDAAGNVHGRMINQPQQVAYGSQPYGAGQFSPQMQQMPQNTVYNNSDNSRPQSDILTSVSNYPQRH